MFVNNLLKNICRSNGFFNITKKNKIFYFYAKSNEKNSISHINYFLFFLLKEILVICLQKEKRKSEKKIFNFFCRKLFNQDKNFYFLINKSLLFKKKKIYTFFFPFVNNMPNNSLFFFKFFETELHKYRNLNCVMMPTKMENYTVLRSPFIFKKGREQFEKKEYKFLVNYSYLFTDNFFYLVNKYHNKRIVAKHKYIKLQ